MAKWYTNEILPLIFVYFNVFFLNVLAVVPPKMYCLLPASAAKGRQRGSSSERIDSPNYGDHGSTTRISLFRFINLIRLREFRLEQPNYTPPSIFRYCEP